MKKRFTPLMIITLTLTMVSLACGLGSKSAYNANLGEDYRSEQGGFSIKKVDGYNFSDDLGIVNMTAVDASPETGPGIMVLGGLMDREYTNAELLETMQSQAGGIEIGKAKKTKVSGIEGLTAELSGNYNDTEITGRIFVAMVEPKQEFVMMGLAPADRWEELEPIFEALLDTTTFFDAAPYDSSDTGSIAAPSSEQTDQTNESLEPAAQVVIEPIRQWASAAYASSEYGADDWSAMQVTGAPDTDGCGDSRKAWSPLEPDTEEYLELVYDVPVIPTEVSVHQNDNSSQIVEIQFVDTTGQIWVLWAGEPEAAEYCPDVWTHTIDLDETFYTDTVILIFDQSITGWGWVEVDAVELVGYPENSQTSQPAANEQPPVATQAPAASDTVPSNYEGWMAGPVYQGYINIKINETRVEDLDRIMTIPGKRSTENWKPRPDHADTFIYETGQDNMTIYIKVTTAGLVWSKNISSNTYPRDFKLGTVTRANYDTLDGIYKRDYLIPYPVMANLLNSPGFLRETYHRDDDNAIISLYEWYSPDGYIMSGYFINGNLTGMAGLVYRQLE